MKPYVNLMSSKMSCTKTKTQRNTLENERLESKNSPNGKGNSSPIHLHFRFSHAIFFFQGEKNAEKIFFLNQQSRPFLRCVAVVYCSGVRVPGNIAIFLKIGSVPDLLAAINHTSISTRNLAVKRIPTGRSLTVFMGCKEKMQQNWRTITFSHDLCSHLLILTLPFREQRSQEDSAKKFRL